MEKVTVVAATAAALSDNLVFWLARRYRDLRRVHAVMQRPGFARALGLLDKGPTRFATVFRFSPGMRIVGPMVLAQSRLQTSRFNLLSCTAAVDWAIVYTVLGVFE